MATRGAIARVTGRGTFNGRYHHYDSYPSGLGATLYGLYRGHFACDLTAMLRFLIDDHPAGWSSINGADFSKPAGREDRNEIRCTICGRKTWEHYRQYYGMDGRPPVPDGAPDVIQILGHVAVASDEPAGPQCYCHDPAGGRTVNEKDHVVTQDDAGGSGVEYVYAFEQTYDRGPVMHVLSSVRRVDGRKMIGMFGSGDTDVRWERLATVELNDDEPKWDLINAAARSAFC